MNKFLLSASIRSRHGLEKAVALLEKMGPDPVIEKSSMIYKKSESVRLIEVDAHCVLQMRTSLKIEGLIQYLKDFEKFCELQSNQNIQFKILGYDQEIHLTPELTVPWPSLFEDELILKCAVEVWPGYDHPILKKNLLTLLNEKSSRPTFEFLRQGPKSGLLT